MAEPHDPKRPSEEDEGLSDFAKAYRKAGPYMAASSQLAASVAGFTLFGWWLDQKLGHEKPWLLLVGAAFGMTGGFISFFKTVLGANKKNK